MLSFYVIYCENFRKILQRTEKVALKGTSNLFFFHNTIKPVKIKCNERDLCCLALLMVFNHFERVFPDEATPILGYNREVLQ